jgi:hypothetical protein
VHLQRDTKLVIVLGYRVTELVAKLATL